MEYNGYYARINYDSEDNCFYGTITGIAGDISFAGSSVAQLQEAFSAAVEGYLDLNKRKVKASPNLYKSSYKVLINPKLHGHAMLVALSQDISINKLVEQAVACYIRDEIKSSDSEE